MELNFQTSLSAFKQKEVQLNPYDNTVYIRKNFFQTEDGQYECQEAVVSYDDFANYIQMMSLERSSEIDDNQLTMMEAIADMYDSILLRR